MQETLALTIVGLVFLRVVWTAGRAFLLVPLSRYLLSQGKVKWAMRLRAISCKNECH